MKHLTIFLVCLLTISTAAAATVELNVVPSSRAPFGAAQDWVRALANLKSVRVRSGKGAAARPEISHSGNTIRVTAVIDANNKLVVPEGKSFSIRQNSALQNWLDQQRTGGSRVDVPADRFGLTTEQVKTAHEALKSVVTDSTNGQNVRGLVASISRRAGMKLEMSPDARRAMGTKKVTDEWQGYTSGTVMAAILRPLELVVVPRRGPAGRLELSIVSDTAVSESWPVGWKSKLKKRALVPKIYDPLPLAVNDTPIADVMAALESRLETPVMYDTALLELLKIDPTTTRVTLNSPRILYVKAISQSLFKAKLKYEIRVDELGKPFFWIMPRRLPKTIRN